MSQIIKESKNEVTVTMNKAEVQIYCEIMMDNIIKALADDNIGDEVVLLLLSFVEPLIKMATKKTQLNFEQIKKDMEEEVDEGESESEENEEEADEDFSEEEDLLAEGDLEDQLENLIGEE
jgi:hypothetical protein